MQEDVLHLILLALSKGELIARKTLVMNIVQTLSENYPQVSKVTLFFNKIYSLRKEVVLLTFF